MATPDSVGTSQCHNCTYPIFVRRNRGNFAYYRCERCGFAGQHHITRYSEEFIKGRVTLEKPEAAVPAAAPEKPAPAKGSLAELMGARS